MAIAVSVNGSDIAIENQLNGQILLHVQRHVTGLTANAANSVPHGLTRQTPAGAEPATPQKVSIFPSSNAGSADPVCPALDLTNDGTLANGTGPGWDSTNVYLYVGSGTECMLDIWY